jgi:hypothetical protein
VFKAWIEVEEAKVAAAEAAAAAMVEEEEEGDVGPVLPGTALLNKAKANMGGFLLPGEGDRCVLNRSIVHLSMSHLWQKVIKEMPAPSKHR